MEEECVVRLQYILDEFYRFPPFGKDSLGLTSRATENEFGPRFPWSNERRA